MNNFIRRARLKVSNLFWIRKRNRYKINESNQNASVIFSQVTYYASKNVGDTVLSQCVRRTFERDQSSLGWNLITVTLPVTSDIIAGINNTQALIIGGGGLFLPDTNVNNISGWEWAISQEQLQEIHVPIILYSVGYNYFFGQKPTELFKDNLHTLCEKAKFIGMRNHGSVNMIKSLLPDTLATKVVYQPCTTTLIRKIYGNEIPSKQPTRKIAFNMAFDRADRRFDGKQDEICYSIAKAAKEIEIRGYEIYIVAHCDGDEKIVPYMESAGVKMEVVNLARAFPMDTYHFYNKIDCVIGMRAHAQMIPFGLNCKIISLGTHNKMYWFLEDIGAEDWYIDLLQNKESLTQTIIEKFIMVQENDAEAVDKKILLAQEELWGITQNNMKEINRILMESKSL